MCASDAIPTVPQGMVGRDLRRSHRGSKYPRLAAVEDRHDRSKAQCSGPHPPATPCVDVTLNFVDQHPQAALERPAEPAHSLSSVRLYSCPRLHWNWSQAVLVERCCCARASTTSAKSATPQQTDYSRNSTLQSVIRAHDPLCLRM